MYKFAISGVVLLFVSLPVFFDGESEIRVAKFSNGLTVETRTVGDEWVEDRTYDSDGRMLRRSYDNGFCGIVDVVYGPDGQADSRSVRPRDLTAK